MQVPRYEFTSYSGLVFNTSWVVSEVIERSSKQVKKVVNAMGAIKNLDSSAKQSSTDRKKMVEDDYDSICDSSSFVYNEYIQECETEGRRRQLRDNLIRDLYEQVCDKANPTYQKHHKFLHRAINSVDMFDAEVVVVNNDPEHLIEGDGTVNLINLDEYVEVGKARNIGVDNSHSDLIVYLDSDDWFLPNALQKMYDCYVKNKCIIYGNVIHSNHNRVHYFQPQYQGSDVRESDLVKPNILL